MRFGILFKLVALLMLVGVLPLLAALGIVVVGGGNLRIATIGQSLQALSDSEANRFEVILRKDAAKFFLALNEDSVIKDLIAHREPLSDDKVKALDARWPSLSADSPEIAATLQNSIASHLQQMRKIDPRCREIMVTDRVGQLIAATNKTSDYYQADEKWWQRACNNGEGQVYVPPITFDESSGTWGLEVCLPIYSSLDSQEVVGVSKVVMSLTDWLTEVVSVAKEANASMFVVAEDGTIIYSDMPQEFLSQLPGWKSIRAGAKEHHWRVRGGNLESISLIEVSPTLGEMPLDAPQWYVVIRSPIFGAMRGIYKLSLYVLIIGLVIIATTFGLGIYAANRNIVRPLIQLRTATERVAAGDLSHRVMAWERRIGNNDEIAQLTEDFNRMVVAVAASHATLMEANELKSRFIRVAGHELRTPISYIVSMTALLSKTAPNDSVRAAAEKIAARALHLDQIITQMFKLLGEGQLESTMQYSRFNIEQLVDDVVAELRPFTENRLQKVDVVRQERSPEIEADRDKIHDVLMSLMSNAVKFTPDSGTVHVALADQAGHRLAVQVRDEGTGIDPEVLPHIFEPFWGAPDLLKHSSGEYGFQKRGPGLGLAIARHFVRLHGGQILVDSQPTGAEFTILIPTAPPEGTPRGGRGATESTGDQPV